MNISISLDRTNINIYKAILCKETARYVSHLSTICFEVTSLFINSYETKYDLKTIYHGQPRVIISTHSSAVIILTSGNADGLLLGKLNSCSLFFLLFVHFSFRGTVYDWRLTFIKTFNSVFQRVIYNPITRYQKDFAEFRTHMVHRIYPAEFQPNKAYYSDKEYLVKSSEMFM